VPPGTAVPLVGVRPGSGDRLRLNEAAAAQSCDPVDCRARPQDLAVIISSGGSTGVPKGSWRSFASYTELVTVPSPEDRRQLVNGDKQDKGRVYTKHKYPSRKRDFFCFKQHLCLESRNREASDLPLDALLKDSYGAPKIQE
jgi:hypothetical protein